MTEIELTNYFNRVESISEDETSERYDELNNAWLELEDRKKTITDWYIKVSHLKGAREEYNHDIDQLIRGQESIAKLMKIEVSLW